MGGGFIQLAAYGEEDVYLTGNPQITFFISVYRRYTNFSIENIKKHFTGQVDFGKKIFCKLDKTGDLINDLFLHIKLPSLKKYNEQNNTNYRWINNIGHALIEYIEVEIGGIVIDKQYGLWLQIWSELTITDEKKDGYYDMIGYSLISECCEDCCSINNNYYFNVTDEYDLYIPLQFWFCRDKGLSLPIIALQNTEVKINLSLNRVERLLIEIDCSKLDDFKLDCADKKIVNKINKVDLKIVDGSLDIDYIFLADNERKFFATTEHEYLIEQLQINTNKLFSRGTGKLNGIDYSTCDVDENECDVNTDINNCSPFIENHKVEIDFKHPVKELVWVFLNNTVTEVSDVYQGNEWFNFGINRYPNCTTNGNHNNIDYNDSKKISPLKDAILYVDGKERFERKKYQYFKLIQPYQRHTNIPNSWIYLYSFAFEPEKIQPTGTCNFSKIDNSHFIFNISKYLINPTLNIFATNYNIFIVKNGLGGVLYK